MCDAHIRIRSQKVGVWTGFNLIEQPNGNWDASAKHPGANRHRETLLKVMLLDMAG